MSQTTTEESGNFILYLGADWWGSDARALAVALRQAGHGLIEVQYEDYFPLNWSSFPLKVVRRLARPWCAADYNRAVLRHLGNSAIDFVLVFKGMLLHADTLAAFRLGNVPLYCFYPDVSFGAHGSNIPACLPYYDCVFTTKEFHLTDVDLRARLKEIQLVRHGFDPEVHRPLRLGAAARRQYACDVSFVGCWSPKKEQLVAALHHALPACRIRLWGPGWDRAADAVRRHWDGRGAYGDELALIYQSSLINLGLLSEAANDTASGDQTTVRTWQVPAAGGFLLHEATPELERSLAPGQEVATFLDADDLARQVAHYLANPEQRIRIAAAGHRRCLAGPYTYAAAAETIAKYHAKRNTD